MGNVHKVFIGGGGDDWISGIVRDYATEYRRRNRDVNVHYYSWTEQTIFGDLLRYEAKDAHITLVGHSYGGDAAFSIVTSNHHVQVLITIDPVGRLRPAWPLIRAGAKVWLNVRAEPKHWTFPDDQIAAIGGKYPRPPERGQPGTPDFALVANARHGAFGDMMKVSIAGVSGQSLLGGNCVP